MNKKGFTLVELLAVVVIMAIIAMIATPNIIGLVDRSKRSEFVSDAKEFASKANYMYKRKEQKEEYMTQLSDNKIELKNIEKIEDFESPFGGEYDQNASYVIFKNDGQTINGVTVDKYVPYIYLKVCKDSKCYYTGENGISKEIKVSELDNSKVIVP